MDDKDKSTDKILIIRNSALGDVAMTIPVIYSLAEAYPRKEIFVLTRPFFAKLFINAPKNIRILPVDYKKGYKGAAGTARLLRELGKYGFSEIADFHDVMRSWAIDAYFALKGKKVSKLSKDRVARHKLLKKKEHQKPYIDRYVDVLNRLGFKFDLTFKSVYGEEKPEAPLRIEHPAVGIAPFARYKTKEYPLEMIENVIRLLTSEGIHVYIFGGKEDAATIDKLEKRHSNITNVAGKYAIEDELKIMSHMDIMVTMDSANQHLASLAGVRNISIWGSTAPYGGFLGYGQKMEDAMFAGLRCQPCSVAGKAECPLRNGTQCMRSLDCRRIAEKIINDLKKNDE